MLVSCDKGRESLAPESPNNKDGDQCQAAVVNSEAPNLSSDINFVAYDSERRVYNTPTRLLEPEEWPRIVDDLDFEGLDLAITRQLKRFSRMQLYGKYIRLGGRKYSLEQAPESLKEFRKYVSRYFRCQNKQSKRTCSQDLTEILKKKFNMFTPLLTPEDPRYGEEKQTFFTSYYTPLLRGRETPDSRFKHGLYMNPRKKDLLNKSRVEIDFNKALESQGLELFFSDNLFDLYLLHVQGGGRVVMENKSGELNSFYISYDGTNEQSWNFISHYMFDQGYISNKSIEAQREFLQSNPDKHKDIYATCPSYVFFKKTDRPPLGNDNVSLTDNRSIATDTNYYAFKGLLSFVQARRPVEGDIERDECGNLPFKDFSRFYLDQDTGGAIRGKARVDLYAGEGPYAELSAYNTKERGDLFFLMLK